MRSGWAVATLCLVQFVDVLGVTSVMTAIPTILDGLAAPSEATGILATVYAMFFGGLLVLGARLGDKFGHRRVLLIGIVGFILASLLGAAAGEIVQLLVARAAQGAAAAISVPCALRLILEVAPEPKARRTALACWSAAGAAAGVLGYLVGGVLTQALGWRSVFWVNAPIGLVLLVGVAVLVAPIPTPPRGVRLDALGAALLIIAVMSVIVGASLVERPELRAVGGLLVLTGMLVAAGFVAQQRRAAAPLLPRGAFASPNLRAGTVVSFVNTATTSSAGVLATLLLQDELGATPTQAGLTLMPFSFGVIAGSLLTRPLVGRLSTHRMGSLGLGGIALGNVILALTQGAGAGIVAGVTVAGVGLGIAAVAATSIGTDVSDALTSSATGLLNTGGQLGTALGVAALVTLAGVVDSGGRSGTALAWAVAAAIASLCAVYLSRPGPRAPSAADVRRADRR